MAGSNLAQKIIIAKNLRAPLAISALALLTFHRFYAYSSPYNGAGPVPTELEFNITDALKPGIYILRLHSHVAYIGKAKCLITAVANMRAMWGRPRSVDSPIPNVRFDSVTIIPCDLVRASAMLPALIALHNPTHQRRDSSTITPAPAPALSPHARSLRRFGPRPCP